MCTTHALALPGHRGRPLGGPGVEDSPLALESRRVGGEGHTTRCPRLDTVSFETSLDGQASGGQGALPLCTPHQGAPGPGSWTLLHATVPDQFATSAKGPPVTNSPYPLDHPRLDHPHTRESSTPTRSGSANLIPRSGNPVEESHRLYHAPFARRLPRQRDRPHPQLRKRHRPRLLEMPSGLHPHPLPPHPPNPCTATNAPGCSNRPPAPATSTTTAASASPPPAAASASTPPPSGTSSTPKACRLAKPPPCDLDIPR